MNTEIISIVFQSLCTIALNLIFFSFFDKMYFKRYKEKFIYIIAFFAAVILMILINSLSIPIINMIYTFVSFNTICVILYKSDLHTPILILTMLVSDTATVLIWTIIENTGYNEVLGRYDLMCISNILRSTIFKDTRLNPHYNSFAKKMTATVECSHFLN